MIILIDIPQADKEFTYALIKEAMILMVQPLDLQVAPNNNNNNNVDNDDDMIHQPQAAHHQENDIDEMFKELIDFYMGDVEGRNDINGNNNNNIQQQ
jgi:hypothetical protein